LASRTISIFDTTLRDGEQSPGIALRPHEKAEIAAQLERLGVDVVEAGFPASSPGDFEGVREVALGVTRPTVAALCRTRRGDIDAAGRALAGAHRSRIHVFIATSPVHMARKLRMTADEVERQAAWAVGYASHRADEVEFSCEDATRSDPEVVARVCAAAVRAGASIVNLPDTVGWALPGQYTAFLGEVRWRCAELDDVVLSVHCHDDLGLAVANSLAGVQAGATQVECTVNGIGERAGNAALEEVAMALRVHGEHLDVCSRIVPGEIRAASRLVAERTGSPVQANKAVVGANAFAHEAGIHQDGMLKDPSTYQVIDPRELGTAATLPLGKHSGRHAFARACADAGMELPGEDLDAAFRRFKRFADEGVPVTLDALFAEAVR
jgi:2-isopropylmalate synthase